MLRPKCSFRGKALHDPAILTLNGGSLSSPLDCQASCSSQPTCLHWTFYNNTGGCWLQGANVTEFASEFAVSGPKLCAEVVPSSPYEAGQNITHSDQLVMMRSIPRPSCSNRGQAYRHLTIRTPTGAFVADANACQSSCQALPSCSKFTYYIDSRACWLLDNNVTSFESSMAISGPKACGEPTEVKPAEKNSPGLRLALDVAEDACSGLGIAFFGHIIATESAATSLACQQFLAERACCVQTQNAELPSLRRCQKLQACDAFTYLLESKSCSLHGAGASWLQQIHRNSQLMGLQALTSEASMREQFGAVSGPKAGCWGLCARSPGHPNSV